MLLLVIAALLVYWVLRGYLRSAQKNRQPSTQREEDMVRCAHCGVNLPKSESVISQGDYFCSQDHQRACQKKS
ncbi:MAG: PP0621 family protein [Burkholderiales bacterium]